MVKAFKKRSTLNYLQIFCYICYAMSNNSPTMIKTFYSRLNKPIHLQLSHLPILFSVFQHELILARYVRASRMSSYSIGTTWCFVSFILIGDSKTLFFICIVGTSWDSNVLSECSHRVFNQASRYSFPVRPYSHFLQVSNNIRREHSNSQ